MPQRDYKGKKPSKAKDNNKVNNKTKRKLAVKQRES